MAITLVGFRGTGKSTVGPQLAARLGYRCLDADEQITLRTGKSIPEIFESEGEPAFRLHEAAVLAELLQQKQLVIAAGGGAVMDDITRMRMQESGPVVWLQATLDTILERIGEDLAQAATRPALTSLDPREEVKQLLIQRQPLYSEIASIAVATDRRSVASIVDEILSQLPPGEANAT